MNFAMQWRNLKVYFCYFPTKTACNIMLLYFFVKMTRYFFLNCYNENTVIYIYKKLFKIFFEFYFEFFGNMKYNELPSRK